MLAAFLLVADYPAISWVCWSVRKICNSVVLGNQLASLFIQHSLYQYIWINYNPPFPIVRCRNHPTIKNLPLCFKRWPLFHLFQAHFCNLHLFYCNALWSLRQNGLQNQRKGRTIKVNNAERLLGNTHLFGLYFFSIWHINLIGTFKSQATKDNMRKLQRASMVKIRVLYLVLSSQDLCTNLVTCEALTL